MTPQQIEQWAREAADHASRLSDGRAGQVGWQQARDAHFAALVAQHAAAVEREACAQACDRMPTVVTGGMPGNYYKRAPIPADCADAIRARGAGATKGEKG